MKKILTISVSLYTFIMFGQTVDLATPGKNLLSSVESIMGIVIAAIFLFFVFKQIQGYQQHEDVWLVVRNILFFAFASVTAYAIYAYVKNQTA